jgi:LacI family transcriptional regulator
MAKTIRKTRGTVTISEVAEAAGVSPMTVSRVVNGQSAVRDTTREAVLKAIRELNYSPNTAARSLARADPTHLGLLYSNPSAGYLSKFLVGAMEGAREAGCQLVVDSCAEEVNDERAAAARLVEDMVEGAILTAPLSEFPHVMAEFNAADVPVVQVAVGKMPSPGLNVRINDCRAAYEITRHLLEMGHRKIGFIRGHPNQSASGERWRGFAMALKEEGLDAAQAPTEQGYFSYKSGFAAAERLLTQHPDLTAIFASNDDMAAATINVAHIHGRHVPNNLSVVGFDDTAMATTVWPELTTVRQPIEDMATTAVQLLLDGLRARRDGETIRPVERVLDHAVIIRDSTAPPSK